MTTHTTPALLPLPASAARTATTAGAALALAGTFLAWTYTDTFPGDLTVTGYPGGLQVLTLVSATLTLLFALAGHGIKGLGWLTPGGTYSPTRLLALGTFVITAYTVVAVIVKKDDEGNLLGLVELEPGAWISLVGALVAVLASLGLPSDQPLDDTTRPHPLNRFLNSLRAPAPGRAAALPAWAEILVIAASFGVALHVFTYGIDTEYAELFIGYVIAVGFGFTALTRAGLIARITALTAKHRNVTLAAALVAAFCFPFTQQNEQYALIGANILIFATVALGLNVVVGLAGLLDLGYVAFLGVGAYAAALVSGSPMSPIGVQFPFWAAVLTGAAASLVFGVVIGAPTLRLRGDYLAIVTLGFGEIFRLTVNALNGVSGPDLTNGSQGIPSIPDLELFGFDLGTSHDVGGFTLGRSANYYLLMLVFTAVVVLVFRRSGESRIGRAWVAIREDETAATAMGINAFRLKLLAFALGATLAGLAGTVQAHVSYTVTPEQYQFAGSVPPNSAFLLAAVILGGMGTLSGPLVGAALLYLIPAKLQFMQDYQLFLFGLALILLMRFRPEGLVADRRKKLEFHETGQLDVPPDTPLTDTAAGTTKAGA
ncbi:MULTISPECIES: branched-chain amino acid ABC transporter permease [unclassified Streptomyces]|uniref:Branched-chain amino acid ABC transporter permease n=1 Tax=Streptomyces salyersiae TaxID=3075530 RepID=A0ABU2RTW1_9ACTN|nr:MULTISPECIES: branched-chain amino acid ABC transporter permease [unclassified Streptomyces]AEN09346.1 inner-membrane translocator [Streptomyces sp. SirexAA-E]MDT0432277.1 branched-chain amino acid ABC transporter permease [Streptomyces sp. DSM 41770]MYR68499.1 branched-chain amino acid ABC transporter permease [Streptomyces sp. SID4939]MYS01621.1 branched-chain amino acid ABC transporter permease [Streptomyces sp. SID4940]MYT64794.1 branched-chain amino acid ABC transporter permease [Strep